MDATREHQSKAIELSSLHVLEEFELFISDCTAGLLLNQEHNVLTLPYPSPPPF